MDRLFLLHPNFEDDKIDNSGTQYFCMSCTFMEGIIKYYPQLETVLEIHRVDFKRPRNIIIELIGEENQSCPTLIIENDQTNPINTSYFKRYKNKLFINSPDLIVKYLSEKYNIGVPHP